jgi:hypothetical protein
MDIPLLMDAKSVPQKTPIYLNVHVAVTLNVTADEARRRVNRQAVTELGTGLVAREPELVIAKEQVTWRVPIVLSLPGLGDLGQVGTIDVDALTGDLALDAPAQERITQHAHRLYTGSTLSAK